MGAHPCCHAGRFGLVRHDSLASFNVRLCQQPLGGSTTVRQTKNPLEAYFRANQGRLIHKWIHYFDIYDRHFSPYRGRRVNIVEFGVSTHEKTGKPSF